MTAADRQISTARPHGGIPRLKPGFIPVLSYGFRPFFLGAAIWACVAMALWIALLTGYANFADRYGAVAWHAHEFLFGYVSAVMTGFLLTAIPNWTGRLPLQGTPLLALFLLWSAGRVGMLMADRIGVGAAVAIESSFLVALTGLILREILAGRNWRNLPVVLLVGLLASANLLFHGEVIYLGAPDYAERVASAAIIGLIMLIGGRITPSFTHNWLARQGVTRRPAPLGRFDVACLGVAAVTLVSWIAAPHWRGTGILLLVMAVAHAARLARWRGARTWSEPLVLILHLGYLFVPLGALILGLSVLWPERVPPTGALHAWTTGAIGLMTLAVMTRATLGHTGRRLSANAGTIIVYVAIVLAAVARVLAPAFGSVYFEMLSIAACGWMIAFGAFVVVYGPMLVQARQAET